MILRRLPFLAAGAIFAAVACGAHHHPLTGLTGQASADACHVRGTGVWERPDRSKACTPGEWIDTLRQARMHVCAHGYNPRPPLSVTAGLKTDVMRLYGVPSSDRGKVESDHYFPLWLGGATTRANLWPEPNYTSARDGGFVHNPKDALEVGPAGLYHRVCVAHSMSVGQARRVFEGNWVKAYAKYVGPTS